MPEWMKDVSESLPSSPGLSWRHLDVADDLFGGPQGVREPIQLIAKSESFMGITFPKGCLSISTCWATPGDHRVDSAMPG